MEYSVADTTTGESKSNGASLQGYQFKHWPAFARFIRENYMVEYASELLELSRKAELPILKLIEHLPEEQLLALTIQSHGEFLQNTEENKLWEKLEEGLQKWADDKLEIVTKTDIATEDITRGTQVRKQAQMKYLPLYTTDINEALAIIQEMDIYDAEAATVSTKLHFDILKERIQEQLHFIEKLSNTTPGLSYVYNINSGQLKYANDNYLNYFGFSLEDIQGLGEEFSNVVLHPDDQEKSREVMSLSGQMAPSDVLTVENRMKSKEGHYRWMRHYFSVFKRTENGSATEIVGIAFDIENEKRASEQLAYREEQLLEAQSIGELGSFEWVLHDTSKTTVTPQLLKIFGIDSVLEFDEFLEYVHPTDKPKVQAAIEEAFKTSGNYECEYRYRRNNVEKVIWSRGMVSEQNGKPYSMKGTIMDVTERNHMIHRLRRSEELYKQAQSISHIGNYTYDINNDRLYWSDELFRIFGMDPHPEDMTLDGFISLIHKDDQQQARSTINEIITKKTGRDFYFRIIDREGTHKIIHAIGEVLADDNDVVYKFLGTAQDVTEKQNLIELLQNSEALYKQAQAMSHIGNWTWDIASDEVTWSDETFRIYEVPPVEGGKIALATAQSFRHPDDSRYVSEMISKVVESKTRSEYQYRIIAGTGEAKIIHAITEPILDSTGLIKKVIGTVQDITEVVNKERQLRENEEFIKKIADTAPSIITTYNVNTGIYDFVSEGIRKMLGYTPAEVLAEGVNFFISRLHPDDAGQLTKRNEHAIAEANGEEQGEKPYVEEFKYRVRDAGGKYRWLHTYGTVFDRDESGNVEYVLNVSVDITAQVEAEQALQQKNIQLQQSNSSLEDYAYVASHDLKEPLRKISTFSDRLLLSQAEKLGDDGKLYLEKIIDSSRRMQAMISDLLTVSTIAGNQSFEPYSLQKTLTEAIQAVEHKIDEKDACIQAGVLPIADIVPSQFRQLFQNLISNSLKFSKHGIKPEIQITASYLKPADVNQYPSLAKAKRYLEICYTDNGIGFDNDYAEKIFNIFQRLHGKNEYEGTGIGLAICKKVAENHGGVMFAKGEAGKGATFIIIIPA